MYQRQPDNRIRLGDLGMMILNGKRFVVNLRPGVPFNACIEEFDGNLRCWASHEWLDTRAAMIVDRLATKTKTGTFVWNDDVRPGPVVCIKGGRRLYRAIFP